MPEITMRLCLLSLALVAAPALAGPFTVPERNASFDRLQDAVNAIGDGDGTVSIAAGRHRDCAVQTAGRVAYVAEQQGAAVFAGGTCEGKATLVLRGRAAHVEGVVFTGQRVPDGNGAGIRLEQGDLTVRHAKFVDSQSGILSGNDANGAIVVDQSTFSGQGLCPSGGCAHAIYIGDYGSLTVTRSRFERGTGGHYVKSRAARNDISDSSFDDSQGRNTNYMIDLPAGSVGTITRNRFAQGLDKENHSAFIVVGAEARLHPSAGLTITGNDASMAPGASWPSAFVVDFTGEPLKIANNRLGKGLTAFETR